METVAADDLPMDIVPVRDDVLVEDAAVTVTLVEPLEPDEGERVIHEGLLIVSQAKFDVTDMLLDSPAAMKLREDTLAEISLLIVAALWLTEIDTNFDEFPSVIVPVREEVLVEVSAVIVTLVVPLEPLVFDSVIHVGVLITSQEKLEVIVTLSEPPSAVKLKEVILAEIASPSTVVVDDDGLPSGIFSGLQESIKAPHIVSEANNTFLIRL